VNPVTEFQARRILAEAKSQAASSELFQAQRLESGWAFRWADRSERIPFGVRTWVVSDTGKADMVDLGETADKAIQRLSS